MKQNIFVLPTYGESRLHLANNNKILEPTGKSDLYKSVPIHIYITNDEEIKEGDWFVYSSHGTTALLKCKSINLKEIIDNEGKVCWIDYSKKIILTTDPDLIADGIQSIDDEFLKWFVKNPSCEFVEVTRDFADEGIKGITYYGKYFIIIPQEETKQETLEEGFEKYANKEASNLTPTVEEVAKSSFIEGANWMSKTMYSEEEVKRLCSKAWLKTPNNINILEEFNKWFEQHKKK